MLCIISLLVIDLYYIQSCFIFSVDLLTKLISITGRVNRTAETALARSESEDESTSSASQKIGRKLWPDFNG